MTQRELLRTAVSTGVTALMLFVSVAMPMLERDGFAGELVVESEHDPGSCPIGHDHTICTQVGANAAPPVAKQTQRVAQLVSRSSTPVRVEGAVGRPLPDGHPSRAPPRA